MRTEELGIVTSQSFRALYNSSFLGHFTYPFAACCKLHSNFQESASEVKELRQAFSQE